VTPRAIVVGAGIGGLTAAVALAHAGYLVTVDEQAPELRAAGAGLTLWPNALSALGELGLDGPVEAVGAPDLAGTIRQPDGTPLATFAPGVLRERLGGPVLGLTRADLQTVLHGEAERVATLRLGRRCTGADPDGTVHYADGTSERADLVVGADGLHSAVRTSLLGDGPPRYAGYTSWRGLAGYDGPLEAGEAWGCGERFGLVPLGRGRVYWFAVANAPEGGPSVPHAQLRARFGGWHEPIGAVLAATPPDAVLRTDIYDRRVPRRWSRGCVVLLGDAVHPMTPNLGQGACTAIEDALVLARCLRALPLDRGLAAYTARRRPRTRAIVRDARLLGAAAQADGAWSCRARDRVLSSLPDSVRLRRLARVAAVRAYR
jgi:2-polyprenyl-6-methoxyphenol hydroxylase-like FAD-dependent oxidoreductase